MLRRYGAQIGKERERRLMRTGERLEGTSVAAAVGPLDAANGFW